MENDPEMIRQQMDETRTALADKLEKLEQQVVGTVHDASEAVNETVGTVKEAVHETVQSVKESVHETVHSVKEAFDIRYQTAVRPWTMMTGAVGLGFLGGLLVHRMSGNGDHRRESRRLSNRWPRVGDETFTPRPTSQRFASEPGVESEMPQPEAARQPGILSHVSGMFEKELSQLKGLAIGTVLGLVRDAATDAVPDTLGPKVEEVLNSLTQKLGGQPVSGRLLPKRGEGAHEYASSRTNGAYCDLTENHPPAV
jgi:ElaB/YqjD/DUF883 family membrane-anchored ribosome-binding protein